METEVANEVEAMHVIPEKEDEELEMLAQAPAAGVVMGEVERRLWRILERMQEKETEKVVDEVLVRAWELAGNAEEARWQQDVYGMVDRWRQAGALRCQILAPGMLTIGIRTGRVARKLAIQITNLGFA